MKYPAPLAFALVLLSLSACDMTVKQQETTTKPSSSSTAATTTTTTTTTFTPISSTTQLNAALDNTTLTARVKAALAEDAGLKTLKLNVDSQDGVVSVTGPVKNQETAALIMRTAQSVKGVKSVNSRLTIQP